MALPELNMRVNFRCLLLLCALAAMGPLSAEEAPGPPPEELLQLRKQFEFRALASARLLAEQFANALTAIARDTGAAGDYEQALAAQQRRERIAALYTKANSDAASSNVIVLKPADARVNGAVNYDRASDALVTWRTVGSIATWEVPKVIPGTYQITLMYAVGDSGDDGRPGLQVSSTDLATGGDFEFYEDSSLAGAAQNRRVGQVAPTGGWDKWVTQTLTAVQLTRTSARFALRITRARGSGGVMNLKEVRLSPPGANASSPAGSATASDDEFARLQQAHLARLKDAITPVVTAYTANLKAVADKAAAANDDDLAEDFNNEIKRAAGLIEEPQIVTTGPAKGSKSPVNVEGMHEYRGATYVPDKENTADRFRVRLEGQDYFVRLLWVSCPPMNADQKRDVKAAAEYFGIGEEDVVTAGTQAQAFTERFLSGKSLTILTRSSKASLDGAMVIIRPGGVGDFGGVLVDNGWAMIRQPTGKKGTARQHEESMLNALKERETAARSRKIPPGAWGMAQGDTSISKPE